MRQRTSALIASVFTLLCLPQLHAQAPNTFPASGYVGIGTMSPSTFLDVVGDPTGTVPQLRIRPVGMSSSTSSVPSYLDFYSTFDNYPSDQGPRRTATIKARFSGGTWASEVLAFEVGTGWTNDIGAEPTERMRITGSGNVGIGTTSPVYTLDVAGSIHSAGAVIASGGVIFPDGSTQTSAFNPTLCGGDYAESVDVSGDRTKYGPGDVLVADPDHDGNFLKSAEPYSSGVLGVYSTKPGVLGRRQNTPKNVDEIPMAMIGIVPTKVSAENGAIKPGDLLVTSATPGHVMKGTDRSRLLGAVVGKALGHLDAGLGVIEVAVTLQ